MSFDPYGTCPCGSGKKFKFCCVDLADSMDKVHRHREHHQPRMALQVLEKLEKKHPNNSWILIERASIHLDENESEEAKAALEQLLESEPGHELGLVMRAIASFDADGFEKARPFIYEAFLKSARSHPDLLNGLAMGIATLMATVGRHMAARQFLTLAMRLAPEDKQQEIFLELLRFDSSNDQPYPLRGVHPLETFSGAADLKSQANEAIRLAELGCCEPAAEVFTRLGEEQPDCALFWQNAGLCRAWAGDEEAAADALHTAAQLHSEFDIAVELETMAQLLDLAQADDVVKMRQFVYEIDSASRLLTQLAESSRIVKLTLPPDLAEESDTIPPVGAFQVLRDDLPDDTEQSPLSLETMPHVVADIMVFDADPKQETPAQAALTGFECEELDAAKTLFEELAGENARIEATEGDENVVWSRSLPQQISSLHWQWYIPPKTPGVLVESLEHERWREAIEEGWMNQQQDALRGQTPRDAMNEEDLKLPLTAAVYALDAICDRLGYALDVDEVCNRLGIAPIASFAISAETELNTLSAMQLNRLPVKELNDAQLNLALNRSLLLHHPRFLYDVLIEALGRPNCAEQVNLDRAYKTLAELCRKLYRREEALEWIVKGAELHSEGSGQEFQQYAVWKMQELSMRLEDPDDPKLMSLLEHLYNRFGPKLPGLREQLEEVCQLRGIKAPWQDAASIITSAAQTNPTTDGVWNSGTGGEEGGEKKLWLPGQS